MACRGRDVSVWDGEEGLSFSLQKTWGLGWKNLAGTRVSKQLPMAKPGSAPRHKTPAVTIHRPVGVQKEDSHCLEKGGNKLEAK